MAKKNPENLFKKQIKQLAMSEGAKGVGIASVKSLLEASLPEGSRPCDILPEAKSLISFFFPGIYTPRLNGPYAELGVAEHSINFVLLGSGWPGATQADLLAYKIARLIIDKGFEAIPIPSGHPYDKVNLRGIISQKHAAVEAGLGEMGIHQLLTIPGYGSNVYPGAVITTAVLEPDSRFRAHMCEEARKNCGLICVQACPSKAIKGDGTIDKKACVTYLYERASKKYGYPPHQHIIRCGICMNVCPAGRSVQSAKSP
jgi:epoxyqueuosine reductase